MATQNDKLNFSQPDNQLSAYADAERAKLFPRNDFSPESDNYSPQHPDAMADGDNIGRGTGTYLDIYNQKAGTKEDVQLRNEEIKINRYNSSQPYYVSDQGNNGSRPMANL